MLNGAHFESDSDARVVRIALSDGAPPDRVVIHDTQLLFSAQFKKVGADLILTGDGPALALSFVDGTAFNMSTNARMVLNELVYEANSPSNSALISLVRGTLTFVAGQIPKTGDMRVDTPVATMGIRGTTVNTTIDADIAGNVYSVTYSLMTDPDGRIGSFEVLDRVAGAVPGAGARNG